MVDGMIQRIRQDTGCPDAKVILTGGLSGVVVPGLQTPCVHDLNLTLDGLRILFELNRGRTE
jgi:type III pantothenate kinase